MTGGLSRQSSRTLLYQFAEKPKALPFRGTLRAEESLFSWVSSTERFLTSFGMTPKPLLPQTVRIELHNNIPAGCKYSLHPSVSRKYIRYLVHRSYFV
jgi:hypothetical protein